MAKLTDADRGEGNPNTKAASAFKGWLRMVYFPFSQNGRYDHSHGLAKVFGFTTWLVLFACFL